MCRFIDLEITEGTIKSNEAILNIKLHGMILDDQIRLQATMRRMNRCIDDVIVAIDLFVLDWDSTIKTRGHSSDASLSGGKDDDQVPGLHSDVECPARGLVGSHVLALSGELVVGERQIIFRVGIDRLEVDPFMVRTRDTNS
jgi:hypothetical protein